MANNGESSFESEEAPPFFSRSGSSQDPAVNAGASSDASLEQNNDGVSSASPEGERDKQVIDEKLSKLRSVLPVSTYSRVAEVSLYFEKTWSKDRVLSIEDCLTLVPEEMRSEMFERLLEIDISLGIEQGALLLPDDYQKRFPDWAETIHRVYSQVTQQSVVVNKMRVGRQIGNYNLEEIIGKGGMGIVYKALDRPFDRTVAIKYLLPDKHRKRESFDLFRNEMRLMGQLPPDSAFAQAYSHDRDGDFDYLVMEFIDGVNLVRYYHSDRGKRTPCGALDWAEAAKYVLEVAEGLETIHNLGIIHQDIKPENIMLDKAGRIRILDLGLGLFHGGFSSSVHSPSGGEGGEKKESGAVLGTPAYISPEGYRAPESVDARSDLYSLGGTFFYLLTGEVPIRWFNPMIEQKFEPLGDYFCRRRIPIRPDVLAVLSRLLEPDPKKRYASASEAVHDLRTLLDRYSPEKKRERRQQIFRISAAVFLFAAVFGFFSLYAFGFSDSRRFEGAKRLYGAGEAHKSLALLVNTNPERLSKKTRKEFYLFRGQLYQEQAKDEEYLRNAMSDFDAVLRDDPENVPCMEWGARLHLELEEYDKAKKVICRAIKRCPKDETLHLLDGKITLLWAESGKKNSAENSQMPDKAIEVLLSDDEKEQMLNEAIDILTETESPESHYWLACAYYRTGHYDFAIDDLDRAIKKNKLVSEARQLRGDSFYSQALKYKDNAAEFSSKAAEDFRLVWEESAVETEEHTDLFLKMIRCYELAGNLDRCIETCDEMLEKDPGSAFARQFRGKSKFLQRMASQDGGDRFDWEEIREDLDGALSHDVDKKISPENCAELSVMSAVATMEIGDDFKRGVTSITNAIKYNEKESLYRFNETTFNVYEIRRKAYLILGEKEKARIDSEKALNVMFETPDYASMTLTSIDLSESDSETSEDLNVKPDVGSNESDAGAEDAQNDGPNNEPGAEHVTMELQ